MEKLDFSVIICTRNRLDYLKECLISIINQTKPPKEIIIVDDASHENFNVYDFVKNQLSNIEYRIKSNDINITLIKNKKHSGVVASRNAGINAANGNVLAFLDDDGYAHKNWLKTLEQGYTRKDMSGIGGPVIEVGRNIKSPKFPVKRLAYIRNGKIITNYRIKNIKEAKNLPMKTVPFLQGGNMSFRKDAIIAANGGDTNLIGNFYREETDLCFKVAKKGKLLFDPAAITFHNTAKEGGCRDIINFDLERFLYYMFRNTTYFFLKHFEINKAIRFTIKSIKRQINLLKQNKTGLTRDYLKIKDNKLSILSVIIGSVSGFLTWIKPKRSIMNHSRPISIDCFKLTVMGSSVTIIELESKTNIIKKLFGL